MNNNIKDQQPKQSAPLRTWSNFLQTDAARDGTDPDLLKRLKQGSGANFPTLNRLKSWVKERFPRDYSSDWRENTSDRACGRERVAELWAKFLIFKEGGDS